MPARSIKLPSDGVMADVCQRLSRRDGNEPLHPRRIGDRYRVHVRGGGLIRCRLRVVRRAGSRRSRIRAGLRLGLASFVRRNCISRYDRNPLRRFGGVQFALVVRSHLREALPVGAGGHGLREALSSGDLLKQKLPASRHGIISLRCSVPQTNARRAVLLQPQQDGMDYRVVAKIGWNVDRDRGADGRR
jgi:hypothetical protein